MKKLTLDKKNSMLCGVCSGIAKYANFDVSIIRIAWCTFTWFYAYGILAYFIAAIILPENNED